jgi:hypothetical protein
MMNSNDANNIAHRIIFDWLDRVELSADEERLALAISAALVEVSNDEAIERLETDLVEAKSEVGSLEDVIAEQEFDLTYAAETIADLREQLRKMEPVTT